MSVFKNMAYGLINRRFPKEEVRTKVEAAADMLQLREYLDRRPHQLSGGQRQRVAMGRAIVREPKAFLFDEPLSNLDAKLRVHMRVEIKQLQRRLGITALYVTHDQVEAMTLADRLIVMNGGVAEQIGTPLEVYERPASAFVATFIGSPAMAMLHGRVEGEMCIRDSAQFEFGATYLPHWKAVADEPYGTFIGGAALFAMSGHDDAEYKGAAAFFEFLTDPDVQYFWHRETGYVPITEAAYETAKADGYYESTPDAEVGILQLKQPAGEWTRGYRLGFYVQIREVMYKYYDQMLSGEITVEEGFERIEAEANQLLDRFHDTYAG